MSRNLKTAAKLAFVATLFYILAKKGLISVDATTRALAEWQIVLPAMALLFSTTLLCVTRWRWLLRAQGIELTWWRTLELSLIGNFFNTALPGAVSGDFVKAFYIAQEAPGLRGRAFGSILFDRVAGLAALVMIAVVAYLVEFRSLGEIPFLYAIQTLIVVPALVIIAFFTYLFFLREKHDPLMGVLKWAQKKHEKMGSFVRIYEGIREYHHHKRVVIQSLLISGVVHFLVCWSCLQFSIALGENISPLMIFVMVPLGLLMTAVPIMPGGVGTGHAAFGWLFHLLGSSHGADIFSLFVLTQFMGGGIGGLVYLRFKSKGEGIQTSRSTTAFQP